MKEKSISEQKKLMKMKISHTHEQYGFFSYDYEPSLSLFLAVKWIYIIQRGLIGYISDISSHPHPSDRI